MQVEQRTTDAICYGFGHEGLACTRGTGQQYDEALTLAYDDISFNCRYTVSSTVIVDERQNKVLLLWIENEVVIGLIIPLDRLDVFDVKLT